MLKRKQCRTNHIRRPTQARTKRRINQFWRENWPRQMKPNSLWPYILLQNYARFPVTCQQLSPVVPCEICFTVSLSTMYGMPPSSVWPENLGKIRKKHCWDWSFLSIEAQSDSYKTSEGSMPSADIKNFGDLNLIMTINQRITQTPLVKSNK